MSQGTAETTVMQQDRTTNQVANNKPTVKTSQVPTDGNCAPGDQECQDRTPPLPPGTLKPPTVEPFANSSVSLFYVGVVGAVAVLYACVCSVKRRRA
jgi:hypothetical protein